MDRYNDPVDRLVSTMREIREGWLQKEMGHYAFERVAYAIEAQPIEEEFVTDFIGSLPFNSQDSRYSSKINFQNPVDAWSARAFVVFNKNKHYSVSRENKLHSVQSSFGLCIGERNGEQDGTTELLLALQGNDSRKEIGINKVVVDSTHWNNIRDERLEFLRHESIDESWLLKKINPESRMLELDSSNVLTIETGVDISGGVSTVPNPSEHPWAWKRQTKKDDVNRMSGYLKSADDLESDDLQNFNSFYYMQLYATAFGIEDEYKELKAKRDASLPQSVEEKVFGLPDYRQLLEDPSIRYVLGE